MSKGKSLLDNSVSIKLPSLSKMARYPPPPYATVYNIQTGHVKIEIRKLRHSMKTLQWWTRTVLPLPLRRAEPPRRSRIVEIAAERQRAGRFSVYRRTAATRRE